jgi:hypothetical protein
MGFGIIPAPDMGMAGEVGVLVALVQVETAEPLELMAAVAQEEPIAFPVHQ